MSDLNMAYSLAPHAPTSAKLKIAGTGLLLAGTLTLPIDSRNDFRPIFYGNADPIELVAQGGGVVGTIRSIAISQSGAEILVERIDEACRQFAEDETSNEAERVAMRESRSLACDFVSQLAGSAAIRAEVDVDPNGFVNLEWYRSSSYQLSVTFAEGELHCAMVSAGEERFETRNPDESNVVVGLVSEVLNA